MRFCGIRESSEVASDLNDNMSNDRLNNENENIAQVEPAPILILEPMGKLTTSLGESNNTTINSQSNDDPSTNLNPKFNEDDPVSVLMKLKAKNADKPAIAHLIINFLEPRSESLNSLIKNNVDILLVSETKLSDAFPSGQFLIEGYAKPIRLDRNCYGRGLLFFIHDNLPCRELSSNKLPNNIDGIFIEITICKTKWLVMGGYNPHKDTISYFLNHFIKELDTLLPSYKNILLLGDFNSTMSEKEMQKFCIMYNLENLMKGPACYKNVSNPTSIDVMLTNKKSSFENSMTPETGLSNHQKMTITVLKSHFKNNDPITINYRKYKSFDDQKFRNAVISRIEQFETLNIDAFESVFVTPMKKKIGRGNNAPFLNKTLFNEFMHRSKLKNQYHKEPTESNKTLYKKQRKFCVSLLKREKKTYYNNLDMKIFEDNKLFWKKIKPLFSEKSNSKRNITIVENGTVTSDKKELAAKLNNYFIDAVENLEIEKFMSSDNVEHLKNMDDNISNIINRYKTRPNILKISEIVKLETKFKFSDITEEKMFTKIKELDPNKAHMEKYIPAKVLIGTNGIVSSHLASIYNNIHKEKETIFKKNYRPISLIPILSNLYERYMYGHIFLISSDTGKKWLGLFSPIYLRHLIV